MNETPDVKSTFKIVDLIVAIVLYFGLFAINIIVYNVFYNKQYIVIFNINFTNELLLAVIAFIIMVLLFLYIKLRKFKLSDFWISFKNVKKALIMSAIVSGVLIVLVLFRAIVVNKNTDILKYDFSFYFKKGLYILFFVALYEEVIFRGFFTAVFRAKIKKEILSVVIVGIMFAFLHLVSLTTNETTIIEMLKNNFLQLFMLFGLHFVFWYFADRYESILPSVIIHFVWNFMMFIII